MGSPEPPRAARSVRDQWAALAAVPSDGGVFDPGATAELPDGVVRWLRHSISPGLPLARTAVLNMRGDIRIGAWRPFTARQVLAPGVGFIWAASARFAGIPVLGYDRYAEGVGEMRWRLGGLVPVLSARNADVSRSAAGRLAGESALVPTAYAGATWTAHGTGARACWLIGGREEVVDLDIADDGRLCGITMARWGNPGGGEFGRHPFRVSFGAERTFGGVRIPSAIRAGWGAPTADPDDGEFFRATITDAVFGQAP